MTVSSSVGREQDVYTVLVTALRRGGMISVDETPRANQLSYAKELLEMILDELTVHGIQARYLKYYTTGALTVAAPTLTLPSTSTPFILDVVGDAVWIDADDPAPSTTPQIQHTIHNRSSHEWQHRFSSPTAGPPTEFYVDRSGGSCVVNWWPIPDTAGFVRFRVETKGADADDTTATLDLETHWTRFIMKTLASELAGTAGLQSLGTLIMAELARMEKLVTGRSKPKMEHGIQIRVQHPNSWSRF